LSCWSGGWDGAVRKLEGCFVKEGFKLAAKTGYGRTVWNIQGKGIPKDGSSYGKLQDPHLFAGVHCSEAGIRQNCGMQWIDLCLRLTFLS